MKKILAKIIHLLNPYYFESKSLGALEWWDIKDVIDGELIYTGIIVYKKIKLNIPKGFGNIGISTTNFLFGDTNDSQNWDTFSFSLPEGKWYIESINGKYLTLTNREPSNNLDSNLGDSTIFTNARNVSLG